jgi:hypothetical protein
MLRKPPIASICMSLGITQMLLEALGSPKALSAAFTNSRKDKFPLGGEHSMFLPSMGIQALNG